MLLTCIFLTTLVGSGLLLSTQTAPHDSCEPTSSDAELVDVHPGWPLKILCNSLSKEHLYGFYIYDGLDFDAEIQVVHYSKITFYFNKEPPESHLREKQSAVVCKVWSGNNLLLANKTVTYETLVDDDEDVGYDLPDFSKSSPVNFIVEVHAPSLNKCKSLKIQLIAKPLPTCEEVLNQYRFNHENPVDVGKEKNFRCEAEETTGLKLNNENFTYEWFRNCSHVPNRLENENKNLFIPNIGFDDAGLYICAARYKGMTLYLKVDSVCVQHPATQSKPTLDCTNRLVERNPGRDALFQCEGNFGQGTLINPSVTYKWTKQMPNGSFSESSLCLDSRFHNSSSSNRIDCFYTIRKDVCHLHIANEAERQDKFAILPLHFTIRDIQEADYGKYMIVSVVRLHHVDAAVTNTTITLKRDQQSIQHATIAAITTSTVVIVLMFSAFALIMYNFKVYIKVYYKRHYGQYVTEKKQYGAYLAYNFNHDIDQFAQTNLRKSINLVRKLLEEMQYAVYDENEDGFHHPIRSEHVRISVQKSHRTVIFLTLEYAKDDWSLQTLQRGLDEMVRSNCKLIFIVTPGMKDYLKQHKNVKNNEKGSVAAETCVVIERAMKLNYAIELSNGSEFNNRLFKFQLEEAMPKLRKEKNQKSKRYLSTSSYVTENQFDYKDVKFERGVSNETRITVLDIEDENTRSSDPAEDEVEESQASHA